MSFFPISLRQKLSQARPGARIRFRSETVPFDIAPMVAIESILMISLTFAGLAFRTTAAAANSAIKLFPSERTVKPPDQRGRWDSSVMKMPLPEFGDLPWVEVDPSV